MDRFVAMIWDQEDQSRLWQVKAWGDTLQRQSPKWTCVLDAPGLRIFSFHHRGEEPVVTRWQGATGIALGVLFRRGEEKKGRVQGLDQGEAEKVAASGGDELVRNYWGNYVAIWRDAETQQTSVLRDPCAAVPCFMTRQRGVELLFAHAEDVADLPGLRFSIDWTFLHAFLVFEAFVTEHVALENVRELLGGERLELSANGERKFSWAWNGAEVAGEPNRQGFNDAKAELRETAEACFSAWGAEYSNPVVRLSGGLDSSIVVSLLRRASGADVTAMHLLGTGYEQYEDKLAALVAEHAGVRLETAVSPPKVIDWRQMLNGPRLCRPLLQMMGANADTVTMQVADRVGAACFMAGHGGDALFLQRASAKDTLADYLRLNGMGRDAWRIAYESAMMQRISVWKSLSGAFSDLWLRPRGKAFAHHQDQTRSNSLTPQGMRSVPDSYVNHPWFRQAERLPPGKTGQLQNIVALHHYYQRQGSGLARDALNPLFSQPIAEFALRTPTYVLAHGGVDRALERAAFRDLLPEAVVRRTGKGLISHQLARTFQANVQFARELILDGGLIEQGLLDRTRIEHMLSDTYAANSRGLEAMYPLIVAECWLKTWERNEAVKAA